MSHNQVGRTLTGPCGSALEIIPAKDSKPHTSIATWMLTCPGQSIFWSKYILSMIHLRPVPGIGDAYIRVPGATHEVIVYAMDPTRNPVPEDVETWKALEPINVEEQMHLPSDESAAQMAEQLVQAVLQGILWAEPPLSGQREPWHTVIIKTSAHYRGEEHAP